MTLKALLLSCLLAFTASAANAAWQYSDGEGSYYAYTTDGGFVRGSYESGIVVHCDDLNYCSLRVWIEGELPQLPVAVTFEFSSGRTISRLAEAPGGIDPVIGFDSDLRKALMTEDSVKVSVPNVGSYTFSLTGSSAAIKSAMEREPIDLSGSPDYSCRSTLPSRNGVMYFRLT